MIEVPTHRAQVAWRLLWPRITVEEAQYLDLEPLAAAAFADD